ncbi:hypothetical protein X975_18093, partial [Stegodyphus mimosarum]
MIYVNSVSFIKAHFRLCLSSHRVFHHCWTVRFSFTVFNFL